MPIGSRRGGASTIIIPHEWLGAVDCCGCIIPVIRGDEADLVCNECGGVVRTVPNNKLQQTLERLAASEDMTSAICSHCGALNVFPGFSAIEAFICSECGEGVAVKHPISVKES